MTDAPAPLTAVTDAEMDQTMLVPSYYVNKIYVQTSPVGVRITYAENRGLEFPSIVRTSVFLSPADALALRDLLTDQLKNYVFTDLKGLPLNG